MAKVNIEAGLECLRFEFGEYRVNKAIQKVKQFNVEIPSWIFGDFGGGRFGEYTPPGCARNISEKLADAALVNKITGATDQVAVHVLWDLTSDGSTGSMKVASDVAQEVAA